MSARLARAARLVELASGRVDAARLKLGEAQRLVASARAELDRCERAWARAAETPVAAVTVAEELERQSAHLRTLRIVAQQAGLRAEEAATLERQCHGLVAEAAQHKRKLELWLERLTDSERKEQAVAEARAADELAARTVRQRP